MGKHTPGPYKIIDDDDDYIAITDLEQEFGICRLDLDASESREVMKANARLIAEAPMMKICCEAALAYLLLPDHLDKTQLLLALSEVVRNIKGIDAPSAPINPILPKSFL